MIAIKLEKNLELCYFFQVPRSIHILPSKRVIISCVLGSVLIKLVIKSSEMEYVSNSLYKCSVLEIFRKRNSNLVVIWYFLQVSDSYFSFSSYFSQFLEQWKWVNQWYRCFNGGKPPKTEMGSSWQTSCFFFYSYKFINNYVVSEIFLLSFGPILTRAKTLQSFK